MIYRGAGRWICICLLLVLFPAAGGAKRLKPAFLEGVTVRPELGQNKIMVREDLPGLTQLVHYNKRLFKQFMDFYRGNIPNLILDPPLDVTSMSCTEIVRSDIPDFTALRTTARYITVCGDYYRLSGKPARAARVYLTVFKCGVDVGHGFGTLKILINHMISIAIRKLALKRLAFLFAAGSLPRAMEVRVIEEIAGLSALEVPLIDVVRLDKEAQTRYDIKELALAGELGNLSWFGKSIYRLFGARATRIFRPMVSRLFDTVIKAVQLDYRRGTPLLDQVNAEIETVARRAGNAGVKSIFSPAKTMADALLSICFSNWKRAYFQDFTVTMFKNGLEIIHRLNDYRRRHGTYPETLDELPRDAPRPLPADPCTGDPFLYRRVDESFILYCPGSNEVDDHGHKSDDVVIYTPDSTGTVDWKHVLRALQHE